MKRNSIISSMAGLLLLAVAPLSMAELPQVDVYILAGQSNMSGRVNTGFTADPAIDGDILYFYRTDGPAGTDRTSGGKLTTLAPLNTGFYGPEIAMARALHAVAENKIAIIKVCKGGTSLQNDWNSRSASGNPWWQHWVNETTVAVAELKALGYDPVLKGIGWLQGESDQSEPARSNYESNFQHLIADILAHLNEQMDVEGARFVTALIKRLGVGGMAVRNTQIAVMDSMANGMWFDTIDLNFLSDNAHFDEAGNNTIGERFAENFLFQPTLPKVDVYILAGQSNMSGRVNTGFTADPAVDDDILYFYRTDGPAGTDRTTGGKFTTLAPLNTGFYGPEIVMARALHTVSENKLAIIKISKGGTSLGVQWNSRAGSGNTWWQHWVADTNAALAELEALGYDPVLKGIGWLQGESDQSEPNVSNYESNFQDLLADMQAHLEGRMDIEGTRVITALIKRLGAGGRRVRDTQVAVMDAVANWLWFDTIDLDFLSDNAHFDEPGNNTIGERFAERFLLPPTISFLQREGGELDLIARGVIYSSEDLFQWQRIEPQPPSISNFASSLGSTIFFQARDR